MGHRRGTHPGHRAALRARVAANAATAPTQRWPARRHGEGDEARTHRHPLDGPADCWVAATCTRRQDDGTQGHAAAHRPHQFRRHGRCRLRCLGLLGFLAVLPGDRSGLACPRSSRRWKCATSGRFADSASLVINAWLVDAHDRTRSRGNRYGRSGRATGTNGSSDHAASLDVAADTGVPSPCNPHAGQHPWAAPVATRHRPQARRSQYPGHRRRRRRRRCQRSRSSHRSIPRPSRCTPASHRARRPGASRPLRHGTIGGCGPLTARPERCARRVLCRWAE